MSNGPSDMQLVDDAIAALDHIPPNLQKLALSDGESTSHDTGPLIQEFGLNVFILRGKYEALETGKFGDGTPVDEANRARLQQDVDDREKNTRWAALPWGMERLSKLILKHLDGALYDPSHHGFQGPCAGKGILALQLRSATAVEWLVHCPQRCASCRTRCRNDLERLRRALREEAERARRSDPAVHWRETTDPKKPGNRQVEIWDGTRNAKMKGRSADLFLEVAAKSPQQLLWGEFIDYRLGVAKVRIESKSARTRSNGADRTPRPALRADSMAKTGRRVRKDLGQLGTFWNQDTTGAVWTPPEGSGPEPD